MAAPSAVYLAFALAACSTDHDSSAPSSTAPHDAGVTSTAESHRDADEPTSPAPDANESSASTPSDAGSSPPPAAMDAAAMSSAMPDASTASPMDAAPPPADARVAPRDLGGCCAAHDNPGCSNADLQVCVCEKLPSCCTGAWDSACVLIVKQKYCQPGVRDCVCGSGPQQWGQHACCDSNWSDTFCNQVAEQKCGAAPGCL